MRVLFQINVYAVSRRWPRLMNKVILDRARKALVEDYDIKTHFTPSYNPWDQRLCAVPENDLFSAIRSGKVEVVTDRISRFTERGILLESGRELEADIVVAATGLNMKFMGGAQLTVDGRATP